MDPDLRRPVFVKIYDGRSRRDLFLPENVFREIVHCAFSHFRTHLQGFFFVYGRGGTIKNAIVLVDYADKAKLISSGKLGSYSHFGPYRILFKHSDMELARAVKIDLCNKEFRRLIDERAKEDKEPWKLRLGNLKKEEALIAARCQEEEN